MKMIKKHAKAISYDSKKRSRKDIKYIVIHYTGNNGDTAQGNLNYFATSNTRQAGAHFFISADGTIGKSINMNLTAWAVGGFYGNTNGRATYYQKCTNHNSVSIELCDATKNYTDAQADAVKRLIQYIRKYCPNAQTVIRHSDVNGKTCPACLVDNKKWAKFLVDIDER